MSDHYGNLDIFGRLSVSQNLSGGYQFPDYKGTAGELLGIDETTGELIFASPSFFNILSGQRGSTECSIGNRFYSISYNSIVTEDNYPVVSLVIPTSSSDLYVQGIYDVTENGFNVALSNTPDVSGYKINWKV